MKTPVLHADLDDASLRRLIKKIISLGGNRRLFILAACLYFGTKDEEEKPDLFQF